MENHDIVKAWRAAPDAGAGGWLECSGAGMRAVEDGFATGLLLTAPGIPQMFMGQEFLEDEAMVRRTPGLRTT